VTRSSFLLPCWASMGGSPRVPVFCRAFPDGFERLIFGWHRQAWLDEHNKRGRFHVARKRGVIGRWLCVVAFPTHIPPPHQAERDTPVHVPAYCPSDHSGRAAGLYSIIVSRGAGQPPPVLCLTLLRDGTRATPSFLQPRTAVWGTQDRVIPPQPSAAFAEWNRTAEHEDRFAVRATRPAL